MTGLVQVFNPDNDYQTVLRPELFEGTVESRTAVLFGGVNSFWVLRELLELE